MYLAIIRQCIQQCSRQYPEMCISKCTQYKSTILQQVHKIHFNPVRHSTVIITIDQLLLWWLFAEMLLFSQCSLDGGRTEQRT